MSETYLTGLFVFGLVCYCLIVYAAYRRPGPRKGRRSGRY